MYQNLHFINITEFYLYYIFEIIYTKLHFLTVILALYFFYLELWQHYSGHNEYMNLWWRRTNNKNICI